MGRILKLGHIEINVDNPIDVPNVYWDRIEKSIADRYGKGWRLPTLEELQYIREIKDKLNLLFNLNVDDDYWTSTSGQPDYIPDRNEFEEDYRWFYQVRMQDEPFSGNTQRNINKGFLCHASYYGNILPVKDI
jgi:hypothetical protein